MTSRHLKILFITANRVGDAVLSTGIVSHLVAQNPGATITIACGPFGADLFRAVPGLTRLHIMKKRKWHGHWLDLWKATRGTKWDIVVDLRNSLISRIIPARRRYIHRGNTGAHKVIENGLVIGQNPPPTPHIWVDSVAEDKAAKLLPAGVPLLALGPAANWPPKQWPIEYFTELAKRLTAAGGPLPNAKIVVLADEKEREQIAPLITTLGGERVAQVIGHDLLTAAACLKHCQLFVGNDSGLMHLAATVGTPTLGLFGPGYENIYGPWGPRAAFVRTKEPREELLARLPDMSAKAPNLMGGLSVDRVYEAVKKLLRV